MPSLAERVARRFLRATRDPAEAVAELTERIEALKAQSKSKHNGLPTKGKPFEWAYRDSFTGKAYTLEAKIVAKSGQTVDVEILKTPPGLEKLFSVFPKSSAGNPIHKRVHVSEILGSDSGASDVANEISRLERERKQYQKIVDYQNRQPSAIEPIAPGSTTYPDGRQIPVAGDKVYKSFGGFAGMGATLEGVVQRGGKKVKITGGGSVMGGDSDVPYGKTMNLDRGWTVVGDPSIAAKAEAEKREKADRASQNQTNKELAADFVQREIKRRRLVPCTAANTKPGDVVISIWSDFAFDRGDPHKTHEKEYTVGSIDPPHSVEFDDGSTGDLSRLYHKP